MNLEVGQWVNCDLSNNIQSRWNICLTALCRACLKSYLSPILLTNIPWQMLLGKYFNLAVHYLGEHNLRVNSPLPFNFQLLGYSVNKFFTNKPKLCTLLRIVIHFCVKRLLLIFEMGKNYSYLLVLSIDAIRLTFWKKIFFLWEIYISI